MSAFSLADHLIAAFAAAGAGAVNAIAGGGTLISFPTLVALGAGRVSANVTNTVALCPGYFGGAVAQRSQLPGQRARLVRLSIAAGARRPHRLRAAPGHGRSCVHQVGAVADPVGLRTAGWAELHPQMARHRHPVTRRTERDRGARRRSWCRSTAATSAPASASPCSPCLGLVIDETLPRLNALKQVLALVINVVAACFFAGSGHVIWSLVAVMAPASLLGGLAGGKLVNRIKPSLLRGVVVTYGTVLALYYLVR